MRKCDVEEIYMKRNLTVFSVVELHVDCMVEKRNVGTKLEIFAPLGFDTMQIVSYLMTFQDNLSVPSSRVKTIQEESSWTA